MGPVMTKPCEQREGRSSGALLASLVVVITVAAGGCVDREPPRATPAVTAPTGQAAVVADAGPLRTRFSVGQRYAFEGSYAAAVDADTRGPAGSKGGDNAAVHMRHVQVRMPFRLELRVDALGGEGGDASAAQLIGQWWATGPAEGLPSPDGAPVRVRMTVAADGALLDYAIDAERSDDATLYAYSTLRMLDTRLPASPGAVRVAKSRDGVPMRWVANADGSRINAVSDGFGATGAAASLVQRKVLALPRAGAWLEGIDAEERTATEASANRSQLHVTARRVAPDAALALPPASSWRREAETQGAASVLVGNVDKRELGSMSIEAMFAYRAALKSRGEILTVQNALMQEWLAANREHAPQLIAAINGRKLADQYQYIDAISGLARSDDPRALATLHDWLADPAEHVQIRFQSAVSLSMETTRPPADLVDLLKAMTEEVQMLPGQVLLQQVGATMMGAIAQLHRERAPKLAAQARAELVRRLSNPNVRKETAFAALMGLGNTRDDSLFDLHRRYLTHGDGEVALKAWQTLKGYSLDKLTAEISTLWELASPKRHHRGALMAVLADKTEAAQTVAKPIADLVLGDFVLRAATLNGDYDVAQIRILGTMQAQHHDPMIEELLHGKYAHALRARDMTLLPVLLGALGERAADLPEWLSKGAAAPATGASKTKAAAATAPAVWDFKAIQP